MTNLSVTHVAGDRFEVQVRGHRLVVDQPVDDGGEDQGPTPTELFVASLAACVAFYAGRFLSRHGLTTEGLAVRCASTMSTGRLARVESITLEVVTGQPLADNRRKALLAVVDHCTVHNSIRNPPEVRIALVEADRTEDPLSGKADARAAL